jgi:hypothetical protein
MRKEQTEVTRPSGSFPAHLPSQYSLAQGHKAHQDGTLDFLKIIHRPMIYKPWVRIVYHPVPPNIKIERILVIIDAVINQDSFLYR